MLYSFVLQFVADRKEAEGLLGIIFQRLSTKLDEACQSPLSVYCWMQVEARKTILQYSRNKQQADPGYSPKVSELLFEEMRQYPCSYLSLLRGATQEEQWVFRETFLKGRQKEELARRLGKDCAYVDKLLKDSLIAIRSRLL
jgi:hypothetical protein